jgi:hypothetical protein
MRRLLGFDVANYTIVYNQHLAKQPDKLAITKVLQSIFPTAVVTERRSETLDILTITWESVTSSSSSASGWILGAIAVVVVGVAIYLLMRYRTRLAEKERIEQEKLKQEKLEQEPVRWPPHIIPVKIDDPNSIGSK